MKDIRVSICRFSKPVEFVPVPDWYYNIEYLEEQKRGYEFKEDLYVRDILKCPLRKENQLYFLHPHLK